AGTDGPNLSFDPGPRTQDSGLGLDRPVLLLPVPVPDDDAAPEQLIADLFRGAGASVRERTTAAAEQVVHVRLEVPAAVDPPGEQLLAGIGGARPRIVEATERLRQLGRQSAVRRGPRQLPGAWIEQHQLVLVQEDLGDL